MGFFLSILKKGTLYFPFYSCFISLRKSAENLSKALSLHWDINATPTRKSFQILSPSQNVPNWQLIAQFIVFDLVFGEAARKKTQLVKWHHFAGKNFSHFSLTLLMKVEWKNHKKTHRNQVGRLQMALRFIKSSCKWWCCAGKIGFFLSSWCTCYLLEQCVNAEKRKIAELRFKAAWLGYVFMLE